jgi:hypothetical protein
MTEIATIEAQEIHNMGFTANTPHNSKEETIEASELKYGTEVFITELANKANQFQDMSKRTDVYLYDLLQECYEDFSVISKASSNIASTAQTVLDKYCAKHGIKAGKDTKLLSKFMNCVFKGADRSKISTYSYVIKYAVKEKVAKGQLSNVIKKLGGIQKIKQASFTESIAKSKLTSASQLQKAQKSVGQTNLGTVEVPNAKAAISKLKTGDQVILIATISAERNFIIRAATAEESVISAALRAVTKSKKSETEKSTTETTA